MKKIAALILALAMIFTLCACGAKPKDFSVKELNITLTDDFKEADFEGYDKGFDSSKVAVFVLREDKSYLSGLPITLKEYADLVYNANINRNPQAVKEEDGLVFFEYEYKPTENGLVYHYYTTVFESYAAFWIVQFAARQDDWAKLRPDVVKYAQSVIFQ